MKPTYSIPAEQYGQITTLPGFEKTLELLNKVVDQNAIAFDVVKKVMEVCLTQEQMSMTLIAADIVKQNEHIITFLTTLPLLYKSTPEVTQ